ncbi:MAG: hypothetical protein A2231_01510 [Candidatus Firestonebacteria bacterium RIFOXYA2_FULL_40_8]|nr:MAG: hypothetical protein A2231_01510 [Candidatus Firestonebacteria bacterium RIFOXYA2_FULL_40_8]
MDNMIKLSNIKTSSGKEYKLNKLITGEYQYMDRYYQFNYIPEDLKECIHLKTCGDDKLISEKNQCVKFEISETADVCVLFADKFPVLPEWLKEYDITRYKITRQDSACCNFKGIFSVFKRRFQKGVVCLNGCSPEKILSENYIKSGGANYCMYSVIILKKSANL